MTAITLKNIPLYLEEVIRCRAKRTGASLDRTVLQMLEEAVEPPTKTTERDSRNDLDDLAGTWTPEEAAAFDAVLAEQRQIDPDLWR